MTYLLTFKLDNCSPQKAAALRDAIGSRLDEEDVTLVNASMAQETQYFEVAYVDTKTQEPGTALVEATDPDDAQKQVAKGTKVVASVRALL